MIKGTKLSLGVLLLLLFPGLTFAQTGEVTGTVVDQSTGKTLPGANIVARGGEFGTATGENGQYTLELPPGTYSLRVSFVGYREKTTQVSIEAGETVEKNIQLVPDYASLEEVVVTGYGQEEREDVLGSVSSVSAAEIEDVASVSTPEQLLQGQTGVNVTTTSGLAGQAINVSVRGASSINSGTSPLYVVDGTPITSNGGTGGGFGQATDPLSTIAPSSIKSIEVLKGASATAIYGARAANGVVLIETKSGSARGETQVSASYQLGAVQSTSNYEDKLVNGPQFLKLHAEAANNRLGRPPSASYSQGRATLAAFLGVNPAANPDTAQTFPWLEKAKRTGIAQTANMSISGGDANTKYFIGGTFTKDESYVITNRFNRYSGRLNLSQSYEDWLRVGTNTSVTRTENFQASSDNNVSGALTSAAVIAPTVPIRTSDGSFNFDNPWSIATNSIGEARINTKNIRVWRVISTSFLEVSPLNTLTIRSEFGVDALIADDFTRYNRRTVDGAPSGFGFENYEEQRRYTFRGTVNYNKTFGGRHDVGLLVGTSIEDQRRNDLEAGARNFASFAFKNVASAADPSTTSFQVLRKEGIMGFFGKADYTLDNKYIFEGSLRWDASSRFGDESKWGRFGSFSAGWRIGQEAFLQQFDWLSSLKLRGSIGWVGNNKLNDNFYPAITQASGGQDYNKEPGVTVSDLGNPSLQWETTRTAEGGFDLGLFNERIYLSTTYYRSRTTKLVTQTQLPANSGFSNVLQNRGELFRQGLELSLETQNFAGENFQWSTSLNLTLKENRVENLPGGEPILSGPQRAVEGKELGFFVREYAGVNPKNGAPLWLDENGETTSDFNAAVESFQGGFLPNYIGGITNTVRYKGFDLRVTANFEAGHKVYNSTKGFLMNFSGFGLHEDALNRWQQPGDQTDVPKPSLFDGNSAAGESSRFLADGDWLRIKNVTLGYTLPQSLTSEFGVRKLRIYFQGTNLITFDNLTLGDPEGVTGGDQDVLDQGELFFTPPPQRTFTGGLRLQL